MHFHDPARPRLLNGRPCWLGTQLALPAVMLEPSPGSDRWVVSLMLVQGNMVGYWIQSELGPEAMPEFLKDWADDPERVVQEWFEELPPDSGKTVDKIVHSIEDLGL